MPSKIASGAANGTLFRPQRDVHARAVDHRQQQPRVEVAAGLLDRLLPRRTRRCSWRSGGIARQHGPAHPRALGHEVEGEQPDRRDHWNRPPRIELATPRITSPAMFCAVEMMLSALLCNSSIELVRRDVDAERPQPPGETVDQGRRAVDELLEARDDRRDDQREQHRDATRNNRSMISPVARPAAIRASRTTAPRARARRTGTAPSRSS